ncbi:hypothetical protein D3C73_963920 [compost metagenome]
MMVTIDAVNGSNAEHASTTFLWQGELSVARGLAPVGPRCGPKSRTATQSGGSKLPRHKVIARQSGFADLTDIRDLPIPGHLVMRRQANKFAMAANFGNTLHTSWLLFKKLAPEIWTGSLHPMDRAPPHAELS